MKQIHLPTLVLLLLLALPPQSVDAQVGPGGVGSLTNTQLWLRSDSLIAIQPLYFVTSWLDLSGHMRDFGAVVMGQTVPTLTLNTINGYPAVSFSDQGGVGGIWAAAGPVADGGRPERGGAATGGDHPVPFAGPEAVDHG